MRISATTAAPMLSGADTIAVGVFEGEAPAHDVDGGRLGALLASGEAREGLAEVALTHAGDRRWLLVGLGERSAFDPEGARVAAAAAIRGVQELGARVLCWHVPDGVDDRIVEGLVEGTLLAAYRFDRFRSDPGDRRPDVAELVISAARDAAGPARTAQVLAEAQNAARDLANAPPNELTPAALAERAQALAAEHDALSVEVAGRARIEELGMGAFAAVARGSEAEPALIVLRYEPAALHDARGYDLGLVGKAVTFDSGGLSIKPPSNMAFMKFDMAGGAAVLESVGAIARLGLPLRVVAVLGATENMLSGRAMRPGDVVRTRAGLTIEVNNTDAEGRLVLADCLTYAAELGAERLVDLATLTGAMLVALGRTHAGLMGDDDAWCEMVAAAGRRSGELVWRLPLHRETADLVKGTVADLTNMADIAGAITAAELLARFTGGVPWAHLDIAGTASDGGKPYAPKGASGFGVRLLTGLARAVASSGHATGSSRVT